MNLNIIPCENGVKWSKGGIKNKRYIPKAMMNKGFLKENDIK